MPAVTRKDDRCTGHDACPPRPSIEGEATVTVAGKPLMRVGHRYAPHGCEVHPPHGAELAGGAAHASLGGQPIGRVGDPVSCGGTVMEGEPTVTVGNNGGEAWALEFAKSLVRGKKDEMLLCLPEIANAEAKRERNPDDALGWRYLRDMFNKWFTRPATKEPHFDQQPYWIEWDWVMRYARAQVVLHRFTAPGRKNEQHNIYNKASQAKIVEYLRKEGKFTQNRETFDYTELPWDKLDDWYFNHISVPKQNMPEFAVNLPNEIFRADGLQAALASFSIRALAKGFVEPNKDGSYTVTVTDVSVYADDRFAFQGGEDFKYWSCEKKSYSLTGILTDSFLAVNGSDFLHFQEKYNIGRDFRVFTGKQEVEDFQRMSYVVRP